MLVLIAISAGMGLLSGAATVGLVAALSFVPTRRATGLIVLAVICLDVGLTVRLDAPELAWVLPVWWYFVALGAALSLIDVRERRLPNVLVLPSYPALAVLLAIAAAGTSEWSGLVRALAAGAACFLSAFALVAMYPGGLGFGDVKLAGLIGAILGYLSWPAVFTGVLFAYLGGAGWAAALVLSRRGTLKTALPFGPFLVIGALVSAALDRLH
jgi:leader peptidase (prepilin peptidase)/N-methyltransferase